MRRGAVQVDRDQDSVRREGESDFSNILCLALSLSLSLPPSTCPSLSIHFSQQNILFFCKSVALGHGQTREGGERSRAAEEADKGKGLRRAGRHPAQVRLFLPPFPSNKIAVA